MPSPIRLTDAQLAAVMRAAEPLAPGDRGRFLEAVAAALRCHAEIGDGTIGRAIRETQGIGNPPQLERGKGTTKWAR
jgi:hypothetical protein